MLPAAASSRPCSTAPPFVMPTRNTAFEPWSRVFTADPGSVYPSIVTGSVTTGNGDWS